MKHFEEEILAYAELRIRFVDQQKGKRLILGFLGMGMIVVLFMWLHIINKVSEKIGANLWKDEKFILGILVGFIIVVFAEASALAVVRVFGSLYDKEIEAYRMLVKLKDGKAAGVKP